MTKWEMLEQLKIIAAKDGGIVPPKGKRKCELCGREFKPKRAKQIYCGINCPSLRGK